VPITAVVLMLATPKGRINGPTFLVGWIVGISLNDPTLARRESELAEAERRAYATELGRDPEWTDDVALQLTLQSRDTETPSVAVPTA